MAHEYSVEFRICGDGVDAAEVSWNLDLQPCQTRVAARRFRDRIDTGMWAYNGPAGSPTHWASLEDGLRHVLQHLWPYREKIAAYADQSTLVWWCGHFQASFDGGSRLSPELLQMLGTFEAELYIDNYFSPLETP